MYRRRSLSSLTHSALLIMDTSSMSSRSSGANFFIFMACSSRTRKLASVRPLISVAAFPVNAVLTRELVRCQPEQNALTASTTRLLPVPPAPPRNMSSWSSRSRDAKS
ncbi:uncharacterized protein PITG_08267 [Phytophthora infestans T30-4]|uniref:Uncharacterized protein n=1 Tax=Phytophthora infestans (strain T30-4) TaxID=403677 RepID=D0NA76_PHYIT|nr:uncharacterized protein PITG_08267 [Phytophthora infestans T30-4]EEY54734.1 hypothetical protein PITG_08267 [Phytophthora infestans T30-4]|eukprot:XP_002903679.1 hypothetical protein PITG_08267 [Phytophthora infestans T30-4]